MRKGKRQPLRSNEEPASATSILAEMVSKSPSAPASTAPTAPKPTAPLQLVPSNAKTLAVAPPEGRRAERQMESLTSILVDDPKTLAKTWVGDALIFCPLPFRKPKANKVLRTARTASGEQIEVIYTATGKAQLPYGEDAFLLDLLVSEARRRGSPEVTFESLRDLMRFVGLSDGGADYRRLKERVDRLAGLHIRVERKSSVRVNIRVVDVQNIEDVTNKRTQLLEGRGGQRRILPYAFRFAPEFYADLMAFYTVIPFQILKAFAGSPIEYSIARWLYRRIINATKATLVPWSEIHAERGDADSNPWRIRGYTRRVVERLKVIWPELRGALDETKKDGLLILQPAAALIPDSRPPALP